MSTATDRVWNAYANTFPLMKGVEYEELKASIQSRGVELPALYRIKDGKPEYLDGRNRARACDELGIELPTKKVVVADEDVEEFIDSCNVHRRHLSASVQESKRKERIARVSAMRQEGKSTREIAQAEGVSQPQVLRDLKTATDTGVSVQPTNGVVNSLDGVQRPANQPERLLCERCKRTGPTKGCAGCTDLNRKKPAAKKKRTESANGDGPKDPFGTPLPKSCRDAFCDPWIQNTYDFLTVTSEKFRKQRIPDGMEKRAKHYPFFNKKDVIDGAAFIIQYLDDLIEHFRDFRPGGVCPTCAGGRCADCRNCGLVPTAIYKELKKAKAGK